MPTVLHACPGGVLTCPATVLCDRRDGGHLVVEPPRPVWERSELTAEELAQWSLLVAATGRAMLDVLPVLQGGCVNYWEAGNWALHPDAAPVGAKDVQAHRRVHLHVFGRSRTATDPAWRWGESPRFPDFADSAAWAARFAPLAPQECLAVGSRVAELLRQRFSLAPTARTAT